MTNIAAEEVHDAVETMLSYLADNLTRLTESAIEPDDVHRLDNFTIEAVRRTVRTVVAHLAVSDERGEVA